MIKTLTAIAFALLLTACGGGDPEELDGCLYVKWQTHAQSSAPNQTTCPTNVKQPDSGLEK